MMDEKDMERMVAALETAVKTIVNQYGLRTNGAVLVEHERRWDRSYATLTVKARVEP